MLTSLRNATVYNAIAQTIVDNLLIEADLWHDPIECHTWHEDMIFERQDHTFADIWHRIVNYEIAELFHNLEDYGQNSVKQYVQEVYPEWRESMN